MKPRSSHRRTRRKLIKTLNGLQNLVSPHRLALHPSLTNDNLQIWGLKSQLGDQEGLSGKVLDKDKKTILMTMKETSDWLEEYGQSTTSEDLEEKLQEVQAVVNPITGKSYGTGGAGGVGSGSRRALDEEWC
jgi:hypothetical protein